VYPFKGGLLSSVFKKVFLNIYSFW
jgi:hypothetical protein